MIKRRDDGSFDYWGSKQNTPFNIQQKEFNETLKKAKSGDITAMFDVCEMYFHGYGCEKSIINSEMWRQQGKITISNRTGREYRPCFVTTAVCGSLGKPDDCFELTAFRKFRDGWLTAQPNGKTLIAEYYAIAPRIVANINHLADAKEIYKHIWQKYLAPCLNFIERGDNDSCKSKYVEMVCELKKQYS